MSNQVKMKLSIVLALLAIGTIAFTGAKSSIVIDPRIVMLVTVVSGIAVGYHAALTKQ